MPNDFETRLVRGAIGAGFGAVWGTLLVWLALIFIVLMLGGF